MLITKKDILRMGCIPLFGAHMRSVCLHYVKLVVVIYIYFLFFLYFHIYFIYFLSLGC